MERIPFNQLIQQSLKTNQFEINRIAFHKNDSLLNIDLKTNHVISGEAIEILKDSLRQTLNFIEQFDISVDFNPQSTGVGVHWDNILSVIKRKNPAVASILRRSKV